MNDRSQALDWWRSMNEETKQKVVDEWKKLEQNSFRSDWPYEMIKTSSSTIELIWKQMAYK